MSSNLTYYLSLILLILIILSFSKYWKNLLQMYQEQKKEKINIICENIDLQISEIKKQQRKIYIKEDVIMKKIEQENENTDLVNEEFNLEKKELKKHIDEQFVSSVKKIKNNFYKQYINIIFEKITKKLKIKY